MNIINSNIFQITLHPYNKLDLKLIKSIIDKAYWPIYGNMKILEEINNPSEDCLEKGNCPMKGGVFFSYIALMIYMILGNVLLINLLIAMFR